MALPPSSAANQTAALGLLSCLPMTRRTATDSGDEQIFAQNNKTRHVTRATKRHEWASTVADMSEPYPLVYRLLKDAGHNTAKAVELLLDAKRGDEWALIWIRVLRRNRKG